MHWIGKLIPSSVPIDFELAKDVPVRGPQPALVRARTHFVCDAVVLQSIFNVKLLGPVRPDGNISFSS